MEISRKELTVVVPPREPIEFNTMPMFGGHIIPKPKNAISLDNEGLLKLNLHPSDLAWVQKQIAKQMNVFHSEDVKPSEYKFDLEIKLNLTGCFIVETNLDSPTGVEIQLRSNRSDITASVGVKDV